MLLLPTVLLIKKKQKVVITYDEAVERAIKNTTSIASIDDAVDLYGKRIKRLFLQTLKGFILM